MYIVINIEQMGPRLSQLTGVLQSNVDYEVEGKHAINKNKPFSDPYLFYFLSLLNA